MLTSLNEVLNNAYHGNYGVGAFNCLSVENVMGAIEAAEELQSPIILQLAEIQFPYAPMEYMAPVMIEAARKASVPVVVHLDHGQSADTCFKAIEYGFNSVMFDGAHLSYEDNLLITKQVVECARKNNVDVEAELGKVGDADSEYGEGAGTATPDIFTDVEEAYSFVQESGVDALAIAIGNLHGKYAATPTLNITRLKDISERVNLPLVLHGGTGTSEEDFKACVHNGIAKINVATALQISVSQGIANYMSCEKEPKYIDMKWKMIEATKQSVKYHMELFESVGKVK